MKYVILGIALVGAVLFFLSVFSYLTSGKHFKVFFYGFLISAVTTFILMIIRTLREQFDTGKDKE